MWSKLADYSQRTVSLVLFGFTIYGIAVLVSGGKVVWQRHKQRKVEDGKTEE